MVSLQSGRFSLTGMPQAADGWESLLTPNGTYRIAQGDLPVVNPTTYNRRLIGGECRPGARIMELDRNGGAPRLILDNVPMTKAFEVGPDG